MSASPTTVDLARRSGWVAASALGSIEAGVQPPFSFVYGGQSSRVFLQDWGVERTSRPLDRQRTEHTLTYTDPKTGLVVRCTAVEYGDFPTLEWTLLLRNAGATDTPILEQIEAVDTRVGRRAELTHIPTKSASHLTHPPRLAEDL